MPMLDGKALTEARRKRGWTQVELSEETKPKVDVSTISRIERGKPTRVRANTLRALAKALGVQPESLCPTAEAERDVMKIRMETATRNALTLVARRYGISRESIIEAAPLLFFIAAEQSLKERQRRITDVRAAADALVDLQRAVRHLPMHWPIDESAVSSEEQSIKARDVFGRKVLANSHEFISDFELEFDVAAENPFVAFLRDNFSKVSDSNEVAQSVRWHPDRWPSYQICAEQAGTIVGNDAGAARAILSGVAALHEMPKGTPQERAEWARAESNREDRASADIRAALGLSPDTNAQASKSAEISS